MPTPPGRSADLPPAREPAGPSSSALLRDAARRLAAIEAGNPRLEAEYLLAAALGCERIDLLRRSVAEPLPPGPRAAFEALLARRLSREPLQYILGTVPFCGLDLVIGPGALIPRGETEVLVEEVARRLAAEAPSRAFDGGTAESVGRRPLLIDVGTGSGAILLALLARLPGWRGLGIDRSAEALRWAARNLRLARPVEASREGPSASGHPPLLVRGDLLAAVRDGSAAAVVTNPPYIRSVEIAELAPEIREHEPLEALDGGEDGLDPVRRLAPEAARVLAPGGLLALELAPDQSEAAAALVSSTSAFEAVEVYCDLAGRRRGILARRRDGPASGR